MYQALYRKYRPKTFSDVTGQEHITRTLAKQVATGQFSHAYLFCGTRGTGKTSCAKILARAINCLHPVNGEPCNECEICRGILDGSIFDIIEIDAASNNGVDSVRQIRDEIVFTPVNAKYKVYIIDEVHMLSQGAFNALLKTLEEPPGHAVFILATTESHKVPATILSRCQRFDFFRLTIAQISARIKQVLQKEDRSLPDETVNLVAELADGSMRDALSLLDKVLEADGSEDTEKILGVTGRKTLYALAQAISSADTDAVFRYVSDMYTQSKDLSVLCREMLGVFRELTVVKTTTNYRTTLDRSDEDISVLAGLAEGYTVPRLIYCSERFASTLQSLSRSPDKRAEVEICMLKASRPSLDGDVKALAARIDALEKAVSQGTFVSAGTSGKASVSRSRPVTGETSVQSFSSTEKVKTPEKKPEPEPDFEEPEEDNPEDYFEAPDVVPEKTVPVPAPKPVTRTGAAGGASVAEAGEEWQEMGLWADVAYAAEKYDMFLAMTLRNNCNAIWRGHEIKVLCDPEYYSDVTSASARETLKSALADCRRNGYTVSYENGTDASKFVSGADPFTASQNAYFDFEQ